MGPRWPNMLRALVHGERVGGRKTKAQSEKSLARDHKAGLGIPSFRPRPCPPLLPRIHSSLGFQPGSPWVLCGDLHVAQVLVHDLEHIVQDGRPQVHVQGEQGAGVG